MVVHPVERVTTEKEKAITTVMQSRNSEHTKYVEELRRKRLEKYVQ